MPPDIQYIKSLPPYLCNWGEISIVLPVYIGYSYTRYLQCKATWNTKRPSKYHLKYKTLRRPFNSYIFFRCLTQIIVENSRFPNRRGSLSLVIYTVFLLINVVYPPLNITILDIRDICTIHRGIFAFCPISGIYGSADFHPFRNLGISFSIKPDNIFSVFKSP